MKNNDPECAKRIVDISRIFNLTMSQGLLKANACLLTYIH